MVSGQWRLLSQKATHYTKRIQYSLLNQVQFCAQHPEAFYCSGPGWGGREACVAEIYMALKSWENN